MKLLMLLSLVGLAQGALTFSGSNQRVDHGSNAALDNQNTITVLMWIYPTNLGSSGYWWSKTDGSFTAERFLGANPTALRAEIGRATSYAQAESSDVALTTNKWWFVGFTWDGSTAPKLYRGDLATSIAEVASYGTSTAGSGTIQDDNANNMIVGEIAPGSGGGMVGRIAVVHVYNRVLAVGEMVYLQYRSKPLTGCLLFSNYATTGTQANWCAVSAQGTVTGATAGAHVPIGALFANAWRALGGWWPEALA